MARLMAYLHQIFAKICATTILYVCNYSIIVTTIEFLKAWLETSFFVVEIMLEEVIGE